jgi:3-deoxy-D-manno-octulosonate 8-phosphate phosphatase (KDO 8-P phosphatase)
VNSLKWRWVLSSKAISIEDIHTIIFDFDGVFTDNFVYVDNLGTETVRCSREDSYGISLLNRYIINSGQKIDVFVLSTEISEVVLKRCKKMGIECHKGEKHKAAYLDDWFSVNRGGFADPYSGTVYFGNDLNDLAVMQKVSVSLAPADAHIRIKEAATHVLTAQGGQGFVREGIELLLGITTMAQGELNEFISNS